jgi:hypothetical protein
MRSAAGGLAFGDYRFAVGFEFGGWRLAFGALGPKGLENLAQALAWVPGKHPD